MRVAACDPEAFYPLRSLVAGPFDNLDELPAIERLLRTVLLHDEIVMESAPLWYEPETDREFTEEEKSAGGRLVITAFRPVLTAYEFFTYRTGPLPVPEIELTPALVESASKHANAGEGNVYFEAAIEYLKRLLGIVEHGGSVLLCSEFGQQVVERTRRYPEDLFQDLDADWQRYAQQLEQHGLDLYVPPVLGIVLTRCSRRSAIPAIVRDLRDEWADARRKVWELLDALRTSRTLREASEIDQQLAEASRLFSPSRTDVDSRPVRVLWEILASGASGYGTAKIAGGNPVIGATTTTLTQAARSLPALVHELGPALFGRGAFDLARRVRRAASEVELNALPSLLGDTEKQKLGFK